MSEWVWTLDPLQLAPILVGAFMYAVRARTLGRRGRPVPWMRQAAFYAGLGVIVIAFVSPVDHIGEERLLFVHMIQHLLIGDIGALLIVIGLTGPMLRPILALPSMRYLRHLAHPFVALPIWALTLYLWHLPALYQSALENGAVHAFQHVTFFTAGALMWAAVLEPLPGPAWFGTGWKLVYIIVVRLIESVLANVFFWASTPFYPRYAEAERLWVSAVVDQSIAGAIMMIFGSVVTLTAFAWLFLRMADESERTERLVGSGVERPVAERIVRYGRG